MQVCKPGDNIELDGNIMVVTTHIMSLALFAQQGSEAAAYEPDISAMTALNAPMSWPDRPRNRPSTPSFKA